MILQIAPGGHAVVGGCNLIFRSASCLGQVNELGEMHGPHGLYLRNGRGISGAAWDAGRAATIARVMSTRRART